MKKLLSITLAILLLLGTVPMTAIPTVFAADGIETGKCGENLTYTYNSETKEVVVSGTGPMYDYDYYGIFSNNTESVIIEEGVTTIGDHAFDDCKNLTSVTIPNSVTSIGEDAFYNCENLESIVIPEGVTTIGENAFCCCYKLADIDLPDSLISIGDDAFAGCVSLTGIDLPENLISIGNSAFYDCYNLKEIVIPDSVKTIGRGAFLYCYALESVSLGNSVEAIEESVFSNCKSLKEITLPDSVTYIGEGAFFRCLALESITLGNSVASIDSEAFYVCCNLKEITIPAGVTYIDPYAFMLCISMDKITVDEDNTEYSNDEDGVLFNKDKTALLLYPAGSKRTSYTIPDSVKTIGPFAFVYCNDLKTLIIPGSVEKISMAASYCCLNLEDIIISDGVDSIDEMAFFGHLYVNNITIKDMDTDLSANSIGTTPFKVVGLEREEFINYYTKLIKSGMEEYVYDEFQDHIIEGEFYFGTLYCHAGSTAEVYAIENGMDYELVHFYEDEWHDGEGQVCRYRKCTLCDETEAVEHILGEFVVVKEPTCTEKGEERVECESCDYFEIREIPVTGHIDENHDGYCDNCNEYIADKNCSCICHTDGLWGLLYKIIYTLDKIVEVDLLEKVFNLGQFCKCTVAHY